MNDSGEGWAQCLAKLVAARKINKNAELSAESNVYGVVTDGKYWEFGELEKNIFTKNTKNFSIDDLPELFGGLDYIFSLAELEISNVGI